MIIINTINRKNGYWLGLKKPKTKQTKTKHKVEFQLDKSRVTKNIYS